MALSEGGSNSGNGLKRHGFPVPARLMFGSMRPFGRRDPGGVLRTSGGRRPVNDLAQRHIPPPVIVSRDGKGVLCIRGNSARIRTHRSRKPSPLTWWSRANPRGCSRSSHVRREPENSPHSIRPLAGGFDLCRVASQIPYQIVDFSGKRSRRFPVPGFARPLQFGTQAGDILTEAPLLCPPFRLSVPSLCFPILASLPDDGPRVPVAAACVPPPALDRIRSAPGSRTPVVRSCAVPQPTAQDPGCTAPCAGRSQLF